ncbi:hypothetical protein VNI00_011841 [Paramarasmius palmivorus]|uniref:Uncharacterized protein n=1 Tax=Paramarasmius palmivorus TaxID=297713 RepID=A0AAW0CAZ5_9AGAR
MPSARKTNLAVPKLVPEKAGKGGSTTPSRSRGSKVKGRSTQIAVEENDSESLRDDSDTERNITGRAGVAKQELGKVIVLDDDSDSDGSVVSVTRVAASSIKNRTSVKRFGSVESDENVVVRVTDVRPRVSRDRSADSIRRESLSTRKDATVPDSDVASEDEVGKVSSSESVSVSEYVVSVGGIVPLVTCRKPSARALEAADSGSTLLSRLDAAVSEADEVDSVDRVSDVSYKPTSSRSRGKKIASPKKSSNVASTSEMGNTSDVTMASPTPSPPPSPSLVLRALTDPEDEHELPSPRTALTEAVSRRKSRVDVADERGAALSSTVSVAAPPSLERTPIKGMRSAKSDVRSPSRVKERKVTDVQIGTDGSVSGSRSSRVRQQEVRGEIAPAGQGSGETSSAVVDDGNVFSAAVEIPDDEVDEEDVVDETQADSEPRCLLDRNSVHPDLHGLYDGLAWINSLRQSKFIGYTSNEGVFDDFTPVSYEALLQKVTPRVKSKLVRSVVFIEYNVFKSPARVSLSPFVRNWECIRTPGSQASRNAAFVITGVCHRSFVSQGREVGDTHVKQLHVRILENDWTILQCNLGTFYNDDSMHAPGRSSALVFQTKRQGWIPRRNERSADKLAATPYSSPEKRASSSRKAGNGSGSDEELPSVEGGSTVDVATVNVMSNGPPPYRLFDEGIPLYDGQTGVGRKGFQFGPRDWDRYEKLPLYPYPEVEEGSLVTVVSTITGFRGSGSTHHTVHFNALFAIVLGKIDL